jgi:sugar/nucleoside kinase (ribokinase family)
VDDESTGDAQIPFDPQRTRHSVIALLGNIARDLFPGEPPRTGGAPFYSARAMALMGIAGSIYARCARVDADELLAPVIALGTPVHYLPGEATASFAIDERGAQRQLEVLAIGDSWLPADLPVLPGAVEWLHVAPLLRGDFPAATLAALGRGRRLLLDGQGLTRPSRLGRVVLDADYDPAVLENVSVLKLNDEEAAALGDVSALGVPEVLVTHGTAGATLYTTAGRDEVPARPVGGNHTGTGDAFSIAYLAARSAGCEPLEATRRASAVVSDLLATA